MYSSISYQLSQSLLYQGFIVVIFGLVGVFLILLLFFVTIIVLQKVIESIDNRKSKRTEKTAD
ncbi:MAG TPA: hypothetical protein GXZ67_02465 [Clostridiaceae bacterium]|jgi:Na+-transporting methylmalonyl-CoA/oxaloacetate decarboxylase gamma subunit|nr:hypothetical protein [Clostridiaceae bacterium]